MKHSISKDSQTFPTREEVELLGIWSYMMAGYSSFEEAFRMIGCVEKKRGEYFEAINAKLQQALPEVPLRKLAATLNALMEMCKWTIDDLMKKLEIEEGRELQFKATFEGRPTVYVLNRYNEYRFKRLGLKPKENEMKEKKHASDLVNEDGIPGTWGNDNPPPIDRGPQAGNLVYYGEESPPPKRQFEPVTPTVGIGPAQADQNQLSGADLFSTGGGLPETKILPQQTTPATSGFEKGTALFHGRFEVERQLGAGGMGQVLLVKDTHLDEECALKILPQELMNEATRKRFLREFKALRKLQHPNIVQSFGFHVDDRRYAYSMEFINGPTLEAFMADGWDAEEKTDWTIHFLINLCAPLAYAHERGIIHRDLKPGNIMLDWGENILKIVDFGIAKALTSTQGETQLTQFAGLGTPVFLAPEQIKNGEITAATDMYALGVLAYLLLTGELPVGVFEELSEYNAKAEPFNEVVKTLLRRRPEKRKYSASDFAKELKRISAQPRDLEIPAILTPLPVFPKEVSKPQYNITANVIGAVGPGAVGTVQWGDQVLPHKGAGKEFKRHGGQLERHSQQKEIPKLERREIPSTREAKVISQPGGDSQNSGRYEAQSPLINSNKEASFIYEAQQLLGHDGALIYTQGNNLFALSGGRKYLLSQRFSQRKIIGAVDECVYSISKDGKVGKTDMHTQQEVLISDLKVDWGAWGKTLICGDFIMLANGKNFYQVNRHTGDTIRKETPGVLTNMVEFKGYVSFVTAAGQMTIWDGHGLIHCDLEKTLDPRGQLVACDHKGVSKAEKEGICLINREGGKEFLIRVFSDTHNPRQCEVILETPTGELDPYLTLTSEGDVVFARDEEVKYIVPSSRHVEAWKQRTNTLIQARPIVIKSPTNEMLFCEIDGELKSIIPHEGMWLKKALPSNGKLIEVITTGSSLIQRYDNHSAEIHTLE